MNQDKKKAPAGQGEGNDTRKVNQMSSTNPINSPIITAGTHKGISWETRQGVFGAVNGYALLPEGHPYRKLDLQMENYDVVRMHGGVTFGPTDGGWIGFDTSHAGDVWPDMPDNLQYPGSLVPDTHWTQERVEAQCRKMCDQIAEAVEVES